MRVRPHRDSNFVSRYSARSASLCGRAYFTAQACTAMHVESGAGVEQERTGFVYLVADMKNMLAKIGWTGMRHYSTRLTTLQSGYPFDLTALVVFEGTMMDEYALLSFFREYKVRPDQKGEWFYLADTLLAFVEVMKGGIFGKTADLTKLQTITWRQNQLDPEFQLEEARKVTRYLG